MNSCAPATCAARTTSSSDAVGLGDRDIVAHRAAKQEILLQDDSDLGPQMGEVELFQILAVDFNEPGLRPVEPLQQSGNRRLARAAAADDADDLPGLRRRTRCP